MNARKIQVGTKLKFEFIDSGGNQASDTYASEFAEILGDYEVAVVSPVNKLKLMFVPSDARIRGVFSHEEHGQFTFTGTVAGKVLEGDPLLIYIKIDKHCLKIQKRQYYRTAHFFHAQYRLLKEVDLGDTLMESPYKKAITKDISYKGVCLITKEDIDRQAVVELIVCLPMNMTIRMKCEIVRKIQLKHRYEMGLRTIEISEADQELLKKFITINAIIAR